MLNNIKMKSLLVLFIILTPSLAFNQINSDEVNNFVLKWKYYWETKDIYKIDYILSPDYEYYGINSETKNKTLRLNDIKKTFKENDKIKVDIDNIKIDNSSSSTNDVKILFNQIISATNYTESNLVTFRLFKSKETKNTWKIYREFNDKSTKIVSSDDKSSEIKNKCIYIIGSGILLSILLIFLNKYSKSKCPKCNRAFARILFDSKPIKSEGGYSTVTRRDRIADPYNTNNDRYIERQEQVHVVRTIYHMRYRCKYCDNQWIVETYSEREG